MAVSVDAETRSAGKTAIVAPEDLIYGLSRMFEVYAEEHASGARSWKTFRDIEDATAWLGFGKVPECLRAGG